MGQLAGKAALITGAGQGVGQGIALALAAEGCAVMLAGRTEAKLEETRQLVSERGGQAASVAGNVRDASDCMAMVEAAIAAFGRLDILVNNAQEVPLGPLDTVTDEAFLGGFESGPLATLRLMKAARPHMIAAGGGTIINLASSAAVRWDMAGYGAYGAVKQAIRALTRAAASEWGPEGIRVLTIAPHAESPALNGWIDARPEEAAAFFKTIPLGRIGRLEEDIGRAVAALCSPAMGYLTGATIPLDGGQANFD